MLADVGDRVAVNRRAGGLTVSFGGGTSQAGQFAHSVPDLVLKGRFADVARLDLRALEGGWASPSAGGLEGGSGLRDGRAGLMKAA